MSTFDQPDVPAPRKKLGSLAQSARSKQLNQLRGLLIFAGILVIISAVVDIILLNNARKEPNARQDVIDTLMPLVYGFLGVGILYVVFAFFAKQHPVPIAVISLVLFVGINAIAAVLTNFESLKYGYIFKIIIIVGLIQAIQTGIAYQKERAAPVVEPLHE